MARLCARYVHARELVVTLGRCCGQLLKSPTNTRSKEQQRIRGPRNFVKPKPSLGGGGYAAVGCAQQLHSALFLNTTWRWYRSRQPLLPSNRKPVSLGAIAVGGGRYITVASNIEPLSTRKPAFRANSSTTWLQSSKSASASSFQLPP